MNLLAIFLPFLLIKLSDQSHFRGGAISWKPVKSNIAFPVSQVEVFITTRFFWRISSPLCDSVTGVTSSNLIGDNISITPYNGNPWSINSQVNCYDFSTTDQWSAGIRTQKVNITTSLAVSASFTSCCWVNGISSVSGSTSWNLTFTIDLKQRTGLNIINSSPFTNIVPYIKLSIGCAVNQSLIIPVNDPDGDEVRCRCSNNVCLSGFSMDTKKCIIYFNPNLVGYYAFEIILEDFASSQSIIPLSSVPLQFIANVFSNPLLCCSYIFLIFKSRFKTPI